METTTLARIEEDIVRQKLILSDLRAQKNTFSFIYRLPTEILATTFIYCAYDYYSNVHSLAVPTWVNVSYVCRHWRDVALSCPTLWTYISTMPQRWTEIFLTRSANASLKIHIGFPYTIDALALNTVERVMSHIERIQEFRIDSRDGCGDQLLSVLSSRAPRLQNLEISVERFHAAQPFVLFDGDTPALRTLELENSPVLWHSLKLDSLTTLSLQYVPVQLQQSLGEFLATLSCMKGLTRLCLNRALPACRDFVSDVPSNNYPRINLPHLSQLWIDAPLPTVVALLSCVDIPLDTQVMLGCHCKDVSSHDEFAVFLSALARKFSIPKVSAQSSPTIRSLVIELTWWCTCITFSVLERDCGSKLEVRWDHNILLQIILTQLNIDVDLMLSDICSSMPLTHVQSIHILEPPISSAFWKHTFGHLKELRYIKLSRGVMPELASLLSLSPHHCTEDQDGHPGQGPNQIFAPALEELELNDITFVAEAPERDTEVLGTDLQSLRDALCTRNDPKVLLVMYKCYIRNDGDSEYESC